MKSFLLACLLIIPATADAADLCPTEIGKAANAAKQVLARPQETFMTDRDRLALLCLADAVEKLDARLSGLADGTIPFPAQIHLPQGFYLSKPATEESR